MQSQISSAASLCSMQNTIASATFKRSGVMFLSKSSSLSLCLQTGWWQQSDTLHCSTIQNKLLVSFTVESPFNVLRFKDVSRSTFNFSEPKTIILALNYSHVRFSSLWCLNLQAPKGTLNGVLHILSKCSMTALSVQYVGYRADEWGITVQFPVEAE